MTQFLTRAEYTQNIYNLMYYDRTGTSALTHCSVANLDDTAEIKEQLRQNLSCSFCVVAQYLDFWSAYSRVYMNAFLLVYSWLS